MLNQTPSLEGLLLKKSNQINISNDEYRQMLEVKKQLEHIFGSNWQLHLQGSLRLGTVIRPYREGRDAPYDLDIVAQDLNRDQYLPLTPKSAEKLKGSARLPIHFYFPQEKKPCWTLEFFDKPFSIDITPSISDTAKPNLSWGRHAMKITRKQSENNYIFKDSNPIGYYKWFKKINQDAYEQADRNQQKVLMEAVGTEYKPLVRTNLQRAIQIVKWLRDKYFYGKTNEEFAPVSIILTTLIACCYDTYCQDSDISTIIIKFIEIMLAIKSDKGYTRTFSESADSSVNVLNPVKIFKNQDNKWVIPNPTDGGENFADRWNDGKGGEQRVEAFFEFIDYLSKSFKSYDSLSDELYPPVRTNYGRQPYAR